MAWRGCRRAGRCEAAPDSCSVRFQVALAPSVTRKGCYCSGHAKQLPGAASHQAIVVGKLANSMQVGGMYRVAGPAQFSIWAFAPLPGPPLNMRGTNFSSLASAKSWTDNIWLGKFRPTSDFVFPTLLLPSFSYL